jgi:hypothetical protein
MNKLYIYTKDDGTYVISKNSFLSWLTLVGEYEYITELPGDAFMNWYHNNHTEIDKPIVITPRQNLILADTWDVELS